MAGLKLAIAGPRQPEQGDIDRLIELRTASVLQGDQLAELLILARTVGHNPWVDILTEKARAHRHKTDPNR